MDSIVIPVITSISTFSAAFAGQYFGHKFAVRRETEKYNKECLQNLYSPLIFKVITYLSEEEERAIGTPNIHLNETPEDFGFLYLVGEDNINILDDERYIKYQITRDTNALFKDIKDAISNQLSYASPNLIMKYEIIKGYGPYNYGEYPSNIVGPIFTLASRIDICSTILSEYLSMNKQLKTLSKHVNEELQGPYFFTQIYLILHYLNINVLTQDYAFRYKKTIEHVVTMDAKLYKEAEYIREKFDDVLVNLGEFDSKKSQELEIDAYEFIFNVLSIMDYLEPGTLEKWKYVIELNNEKEDQLFNDFLQKMKTQEKDN
ncbi:hypothetical protein COM97_03665 [Bacillus thuringiensis]|uniref:hypothetical protein n=1 Tax=Bacillus thuringiensis TaxID=1428 RepID=UPI000BEE4140|nr:hypothetical protein [Bacillus thuringiensis]PEF07915.1 hypothetical protein COM97_03665 [Bacillus thuringiensis]